MWHASKVACHNFVLWQFSKITFTGAHHAFNHKTEGYIEAIKKVTEGRGVDVVAEMLANVNLDKDLKLLTEGGRVAIIGNRGRIEIDPR